MERDEDQRQVEPPKRERATQPRVNRHLVKTAASLTPPRLPSRLRGRTRLLPPASPNIRRKLDKPKAKQAELQSEPPSAPAAEASLEVDAATPSSSYVAPLTPSADVVVPPGPPASAPRRRHSHLLPLTDPGAIQDEPSPAERIFPPEWRLPYSKCPGPHRRPRRLGADEQSPGPNAEGPGDRAVVMPRVQVLVESARELMRTRRGRSRSGGEDGARSIQELAGVEVQHAAWEYENASGADYRLRGPH